MKGVYCVIYYNIDEIKNSEVIGVFSDKEDAVNSLIKAAHYEERDGDLLQYKRKSNDFSSFNQLKQLVTTTGLLEDHDLYRIEYVEYS